MSSLRLLSNDGPLVRGYPLRLEVESPRLVRENLGDLWDPWQVQMLPELRHVLSQMPLQHPHSIEEVRGAIPTQDATLVLDELLKHGTRTIVQIIEGRLLRSEKFSPPTNLCRIDQFGMLDQLVG